MRIRKLSILVAAICLSVPASASALSGKPVQIGTSDNSATPAVVVDSAGTAYIAWTVVPSTSNGLPNPDQVAYCMIPAGAAGCSATGVVSAPGNPAIGSVTLTIDGPDVVLVADQFQHSSVEADNYVNEWITPDGSSSFAPVDGGASVSTGQAYGGDALFTLPTAQSGGGPLGYGFSDLLDGSFYTSLIDPFNAPPACSELQTTCPSTPLATLATPTGADSQTSSSYAAETGSDPGVLGVFHTPFAAVCPSGTPAASGLAFVYGSGDQSSTDSYGISPGTDSAWHGGLTIFDCNAGIGVADSGAAGLGALEDNWKTDTLEYRTFNQTTGAFNAPASVDASEKASVSDLSAGQDGVGGIYATYENGNTIYKGPNDLSYSPDGGKIWDGPVALTDLTEPLSESVSGVGSDGQGWLVWEDGNSSGTESNNNVYVQQFDQDDVPADATKLGTTEHVGSTHGASVSIDAGVVGEYDQATLTGTNAKYATGTVTYKLLSGSCKAGLVLATYNEGTGTVTNGGFPASTHITGALDPGKYYWVASYSGDRNNAKAVSKCGSEVLTVKPPVVVSSTVTVGSGGVLVGVGCSSTPCSGSVSVISIGSLLSHAAVRSFKAKSTKVTLATGKFKITKRGRHTLTFKLTRAGEKFLSDKLTKLTTTVQITEEIKHHRIVTSDKVKLKG